MVEKESDPLEGPPGFELSVDEVSDPSPTEIPSVYFQGVPSDPWPFHLGGDLWRKHFCGSLVHHIECARVTLFDHPESHDLLVLVVTIDSGNDELLLVKYPELLDGKQRGWLRFRVKSDSIDSQQKQKPLALTFSFD